MGRSLEWHIHAPQALALEVMQHYWWEHGCSVEITTGPQDGAAFQQYQDNLLKEPEAETFPIDRALVSSTDNSDWTTAMVILGAWNEDLWKRLTTEAQTSLLVGEDDTRTGSSRWIWFDRGKMQAEHFVSADGETSGFSLDEDQQPNGALSLEAAFATLGRSFRTLPLEGCVEVLVQGDADWYFRHR
jgi:hypothetical protein